MLAKLVVKNLENVRRSLDSADKKRRKAAETATKVEGFRLMKKLKKEISQGKSGGKPFTPLSEMARRSRASKLQGQTDVKRYGAVGTMAAAKKKALRRLAVPVRYDIKKKSNTFSIAIGYIAGKISKSWLRIVKLQQEGGSVPVTEEIRKGLLTVGARLRKRKDPAAKYFFLTKGKKTFHVPRREIIDPFWMAHQREAARNIERNFERKLAGERI